jgi:hypothetical protein
MDAGDLLFTILTASYCALLRFHWEAFRFRSARLMHLTARFLPEKAGQMPRAMNHIKDPNRFGLDSIEYEIVCESNDRKHPHLWQVAVAAPIGDAAFGLSRQLRKGRFYRIEHFSRRCSTVACDRRAVV